MLKMTCVTTVALATMLYVRESWDDLSVRVPGGHGAETVGHH